MKDRKQEHLELAFKSQVGLIEKDNRFVYEPMLSAHPEDLEPFKFLGKTMKAPVWVSSMTGGTPMARKINQNLARLTAEFGLGMGLGSCRCLIDSSDCFEDFNVRPIIGEEHPLYANLGISQAESLLLSKQLHRIEELIDKIKADGLILHINPLQEFFQPEGDRLKNSPIVILKELLKELDLKIIVKEVGQGMGPESLKSLLRLPLAAIDFGALGGTNFSKLELLRSESSSIQSISGLAKIGHTAEEMTGFINNYYEEYPEFREKEIIISGGVKNFLDGFYYLKKCKYKAIYGQGSALLAYAMDDYNELKTFFNYQMKGFQMAKAYLKIK